MHGILTINLAAVQENYNILKSKISGSCVIAPAVKADAYGLGMAHFAPCLYESGARVFFVALLQEGISLRQILPDCDIYVLHGFSERDARDYVHYRLIPVLNSIEEILVFQKYGGPCALHFDTGMNRLGICEFKNIDSMQSLNVKMVMSHFASSEAMENPFNAMQAQKFQEIADHFPKSLKSLANSGGIFTSSAYHHDVVRPGYALYGGNPTRQRDNPMQAVVSLTAPVLQIHAAKKGETAGYNQTYVFERDTRVAVVSIGYADGFSRSLSNQGALYWKGYQLPIRGRVSMDLTICDLGAVPENEYPVIGDQFEVIGPHQSIDDMARDAGTIGYEVLTNLGRRFRRDYTL